MGGLPLFSALLAVGKKQSDLEILAGIFQFVASGRVLAVIQHTAEYPHIMITGTAATPILIHNSKKLPPTGNPGPKAT